MTPEETGIDFRNDLPYTEDFNTYTYRNFYNGGGVALGDINNDGLVDIYFTGNIVDSKLYLNRGDWNFEDITETAGVACPRVWSTGASFADINGDGLLDLYVCKAGKPGGERRHNELFINQGDLTFKEESGDYGLDVEGLSIHSAFFDYDKDGDLDCYLLNNSIRSVGGFDLKEGLRNIPDPEGNKFFRNDNGKFILITAEAGLYSSNIGYGLGITLADFNQDDWPDIFVSNDFFERDYLYLNNQNGTFREVAAESFPSLSMGSMGADACDLDNDLKPDLFVTEMLPKDLDRRLTKTVYDDWDKYSSSVKNGYHHQFARNVLHRNIGKNNFLEIGRFSGVAATEWSWAALIQDFDNDGLRDLFVSNGLYKDLLDKDYLNFVADDIMIKSRINKDQNVISTLVDSMPSKPVKNYLFKNQGNFQFEDLSEDWGLGTPSFSNGSAYGDLDNDGDLDLVVNNANMQCFVYRNNLDTAKHRFIQFDLQGSGMNSKAIGTKVLIKYDGKRSVYENYVSKGFESTIDGRIHFGIGASTKVDTVEIFWPDGTKTQLLDLQSNQRYTVEQSDNESKTLPPEPKFQETDSEPFTFKHEETKTNQFARERLLIEMNGYAGPAMATSDINGDGLEDIFIGGGKNQSSILLVSKKGGDFDYLDKPFENEKRSEAVGAEFFDSDNDGDLDLIVSHGGRTFSVFTQDLHDVLYLNDGEGNYTLSSIGLPFSKPIHTGGLDVADINQDGLLDILVSERMSNNFYGQPGSIFILENQGDNLFVERQPDHFKNLGMISDIAMADVNDDGWMDLIFAGEWMPISISLNRNGVLQAPEPVPATKGLWKCLEVTDLDGDG
ncbi:MAG: VCBS repeat-containing protein, partial [Saprospiraceae bacterium]|nr:VCBS repeat-containing protein [Saprospiraceae bacterium]